MRILALDTSETLGSVAALADGALLAEILLPREQGTARSLAPALATLLEQVGWKPRDVQLVAVTIGPGSFTGLRVGVMTAKAFAYSVEAEILGLDTLESIAEAAPPDIQTLCVASDAQRQEVVAGIFRRDATGLWTTVEAPHLTAADAWLAGLPPGSELAGSALGKLAGRLPEHVKALAPEYWRVRASAVGRLAARRYAAGQRDDLWLLAPRYYRRSAAEEKREAKGPSRS